MFTFQDLKCSHYLLLVIIYNAQLLYKVDALQNCADIEPCLKC